MYFLHLRTNSCDLSSHLESLFPIISAEEPGAGVNSHPCTLSGRLAHFHSPRQECYGEYRKQKQQRETSYIHSYIYTDYTVRSTLVILSSDIKTSWIFESSRLKGEDVPSHTDSGGESVEGFGDVTPTHPHDSPHSYRQRPGGKYK